MANRFSGLKAWLGGSSAIALSADGKEPKEVTEAELAALTDQAYDEGHSAGVKEGGSNATASTEQLAASHTKGFNAATSRMTAVMASDAGKANPLGAAKLLGNDKLASLSAEDIIDLVPPAGAEAAAPKGQAGTDPTKIGEATPKVDLKTGQAAGQTGDEKLDKEKVADVQSEVLASVTEQGRLSGMTGGGYVLKRDGAK